MKTEYDQIKIDYILTWSCMTNNDVETVGVKFRREQFEQFSICLQWGSPELRSVGILICQREEGLPELDTSKIFALRNNARILCDLFD